MNCLKCGAQTNKLRCPACGYKPAGRVLSLFSLRAAQEELQRREQQQREQILAAQKRKEEERRKAELLAAQKRRAEQSNLRNMELARQAEAKREAERAAEQKLIADEQRRENEQRQTSLAAQRRAQDDAARDAENDAAHAAYEQHLREQQQRASGGQTGSQRAAQTDSAYHWRTPQRAPVDVSAAPVPAHLNVGDVIPFGPQGLQWQVLGFGSNSSNPNERYALLLSKDTIGLHKYHDTYEAITWAQCSLRQYLNGASLCEKLSFVTAAVVIGVAC